MQTKPWYLSKTIWINILMGVVTIVGEVSNIFPISKHPTLYASVVTIANIALRLLTGTPITGTKPTA